MALIEHFKELKNRLIKSLIALALGTVGGWFLYPPVIDALSSPLEQIAREMHRNASMNFASIASPFEFKLRIALQIGLIISSPVWIYQVWAFITPGLTRKERKYTLAFMAAAIPLFLAGVYVAWSVIPNIVRALLQFTPSEGVSNLITADEYLTFATHTMLFLGISFLVPVVLVGVNMLGILSGKTIMKAWRVTVFAVFVLAAIAAPGADALSMFMLAVPLLALFFLAIGICLMNDRRRARRESQANEETDSSADTATPFEDLGKL
ncbi:MULTISPECIES: twin-arginine translocase subunit TatC [Arthrobacter]|uniref:Sec-independent protein translocase protein TatC n=2 Tax=Arthrobacter TaxID=1663 RepID=A0ABU9KGL4_9MICC|nr:twin-arginine translocase subunit TatC [Arthrobacter sp. YJM1]MDP5225954.1 twin-arginine translocase subunit TatC [Arthrobacter sp. YJM1]